VLLTAPDDLVRGVLSGSEESGLSTVVGWSHSVPRIQNFMRDKDPAEATGHEPWRDICNSGEAYDPDRSNSTAISLLGNLRGAVVDRPGMEVILSILEDEAIRGRR
jgi:hypothetical protein